MHARIPQSQPNADRPRDAGRNCSRETAHGRPARIAADRSIRTSGGAMTPSETAPLQGRISSTAIFMRCGPGSSALPTAADAMVELRGYNKLNWPYAGRKHHASRNNTTRANSRQCSSAAAPGRMLLSVQLLHRARRTGICNAVITCFARVGSP
jgi:hypothetical protein